jgi:hypothetical protein
MRHYPPHEFEAAPGRSAPLPFGFRERLIIVLFFVASVSVTLAVCYGRVW